LEQAISEAPHEKRATFKRMADNALVTGKKYCSIFKHLWFAGDSFIVECLTSWGSSKEGDTWEAVPHSAEVKTYTEAMKSQRETVKIA